MPLRSYKPTSPGRRFMTRSTFEEITTDKPHKPLLESQKRGSGRNSQGRMTVRHRGGGEKRNYRRIDFKRDKWDVPARSRPSSTTPTARPASACSTTRDGEKRYMLVPLGLKVGDIVVAGPDAEARVGNALPLANIPLGTTIHNIELVPGKGGQIVRSAGAAAQLLAKEGDDGPGPPPVRRGAPRRACAASPRSARWATSTTRTRASARPAARATWASGPRCAAWS